NFVGWYCNQELTDPYDFSTPVPYSFTLYAKWEEAYWGANTDLMPVDGLLVKNDFQSTGQYIWPYYNTDGSVTMYNGVANDANWSWPSAYMTYENSVDSGNDAYIYVKYNSTAMFNATIDYLDADGNAQSVTLSQLAGNGDNDFPAGYNEFFVNFGQYVYDQGHLTTSDGSTHSRNVKYTKVTYYVVGGLDEYVRLYDMKFTPAFEIEDPYTNLMNSDITQNSGYGSYIYDNGVLTVNSSTDAGYSVTMNVNKTFDPSDMVYLLSHIDSDVPFNVSMELTQADGDATMEWRSEYYPIFGLAEKPDTLPAGSWEPAMDLNGYFSWNGGSVSSTTVKSVTVSLVGKGTLTMDALQAHRGIVTDTVADGLYAEGETLVPAGSLLPVSGELVYDDFQGTGESVWDYYNDDGSVTLYNTVDAVEYSWPSGTMNFKNIVNTNTTPCIHLNYRSDAAFNAEITYVDANGESHSVNLSEIAGIDTTDFPAGTYDEYIDFAAYLTEQGHLTGSGEVTLTKVTYYVVGGKDSYVRLYDMSFTAEPVTPTVKMSSVSLALKDEVKFTGYFTIENIDASTATMGLMTYESLPTDVSITTADHVIPGATYQSSKDRYIGYSQGIPAKEMGDLFYICAYVQLENGTYV
ncbi:MAG: InlB B-repeat-containing protein, partial [Oscillospiraceae bacterium]|nr:InlB B-repeat-containing protein [Oscillospiraceae bacterium]